MAQRVVVQMIDDLTGEGGEDVQTHVFSLDGVKYEVDLASDSFDKLLDALNPFIQVGRRRGREKPRPTKPHKGPGPDLGAVRAWAREAGYEVSARGRVPAEIMQDYKEAHG